MTPPKTGLSASLLAETQLLREAWQRHDAAFLDTYLIQGVEDPRINLQSILTRHFLIRELFQERYAVIMEHELYFGLIVNWLLDMLTSQISRSDVHMRAGEVLDRLLVDDQDNLSTSVPPFIADAFGKLAFPNYISDVLMWVPRDFDNEMIPEYLLDTFERVWAETLEAEQVPPLRVLEAGCGSANDYRFMDRYGLGRFLRYTGIDLSEKNIRNAKTRFPGVDFEVGSVFDMPAEDKTYDCCFVHDLFEHLSPEGADRAMAELSRVTAGKGCLHFFNMAETETDEIRRKGNYYWNRLSCETMHKRLEASARRIEICHLDSLLNTRYAYEHYYNKNAYTWYIDFHR